jgi:hypothetical protein
VFHSETDKLRHCVQDVILSKISHINHWSIWLPYRDMDWNDCSPKLWCYRLKHPLWLQWAICHCIFCLLFTDWRWRKHRRTVFILPDWHSMSSSRHRRGNSFAQWTFCWLMGRKRWTCAMTPSFTWPTVSPLDFFVWGCMKSRVYLSRKPDTREQLMQRINEAAASIRNELFSMQWMQSLEVHLVACVQARGGHFEQYVWKWC